VHFGWLRTLAISDADRYRGAMYAHLSDRDGRRALAWAFLFWGGSWEQAQRQVWPLYFAAETARREGERDYAAEARLFRLMIAEKTLDKLRRVSAEKARYDVHVIDLRPRSEPRMLDHRKLDRWAILLQRRDALAQRLIEIHRPSP
jgi:hypothetical protein